MPLNLLIAASTLTIGADTSIELAAVIVTLPLEAVMLMPCVSILMELPPE